MFNNRNSNVYYPILKGLFFLIRETKTVQEYNLTIEPGLVNKRISCIRMVYAYFAKTNPMN